MAKKSKSKMRTDVEARLIELAGGVGGGIAGNQLSSWAEKQTFLGTFAPHAPAITALLGTAAFILIPQNTTMGKFAAFAGLGMAITGGTEEAEKGLGALQGYIESNLGFTPQVIPGVSKDAVGNNYVNRVPIR